MRTELFYYLVVGAAGLGLRLWLERSMRPVIAGRRAPQRSVPPPRFEADPRSELESIASALDLSIERTGSAAAAWSPQHAIEQVRRIQRFAQLAPAAGPYR